MADDRRSLRECTIRPSCTFENKNVNISWTGLLCPKLAKTVAKIYKSNTYEVLHVILLKSMYTRTWQCLLNLLEQLSKWAATDLFWRLEILKNIKGVHSVKYLDVKCSRETGGRVYNSFSVVLVINFLYFHLIPQNHWANFWTKYYYIM